MNYYSLDEEEVLKKLKTTKEGLTSKEALKRIEKYGANELKQKKKKNILIRFLEQFKDFALIILIIAAIVSAIVAFANSESFTDTIVIIVVVILNAIIGVMQELKAEKSLEALKKLTQHETKSIRDGKVVVLPARELVPGDIVVLDTGDYIPADLRLIDTVNLKVQESSLTGESVPVDKQTKKIDNNVQLADRTNMAYSSTLVTNGRAKGVVVETGMNTQVGKIAEMLDSVDEAQTPLKEKLNKLSKVLAITSICICILIFVLGLIEGKPFLDMLMTSISLAVAVIPESLVTISTITLAIGVQKMAKQNAIVKSLPAVETLGSSTVICSDKTGTLTQNKMTVTKVFVDGKTLDILDTKKETIREKIEESKISRESLENLVKSFYLCNDTKIGKNNELTGDPTETALYDMAFTLGYVVQDFKFPREYEIPFDSSRKLMTTINKVEDKYIAFVKGGVDELLQISKTYYVDGNIIDNKEQFEKYKSQIKNENEQMAKNALRVLACGFKVLSKKEVEQINLCKSANNEEQTKELNLMLENNICFIGLVGMIDPLRKEVKKAVETTKKAGIKTIMITGDHKITATAIAKELGILDDENQAMSGEQLDKLTDKQLEKEVKNYAVFSRVSPEHKVKIVNALQANDEIVAMTGDGVNDSPALKKANIGCAMGKVGTDVAKEAADVILTDDNFATIVKAVEEGRRIYTNIIKSIEFLLSSNIGETVCILLATVFFPLIMSKFGLSNGTSLTILLPIQILLINLVTDSLPALAFAFNPAQEDIMDKKPNRQKNIFNKSFTWRVIYQGTMIGLISFGAFLLGLRTKTPILGLTLDETKIEVGQTMAFIALAFGELVHCFNVLSAQKSIFKSKIGQYTKLLLAVGASMLIILAIILIPFLRNIFRLVLLPKENIIELIMLIISPIVIVEILKLLKLNGKD